MNTLEPAVFDTAGARSGTDAASHGIATARANAFGAVPDESARIGATSGDEGGGTARNRIDKFLVDCRNYLGL